VFVTTKLDAAIKAFEGAKEAIDGSLKTLGLDHIDLMIIHSPQPWTDFREGEHFFEGNLAAWRALEEAYAAGKLRSIGVSNFEAVDLDNLLENGSVKPMVNQILAHVSNTPFDVIDYTQKKGILVEAYSPVAHGKILDNPQLAAMAESYGVSIPSSASAIAFSSACCLSQVGQSRAYAGQCCRGLRDFRFRYRCPEGRRSHQELRRCQPFPGLRG
jgi:diketogulonate reductase-like aldo/keto reductase